MKRYKDRPPGVDVWEPGFLKPREEYTKEEVKEIKRLAKQYKKEGIMVDFLSQFDLEDNE